MYVSKKKKKKLGHNLQILSWYCTCFRSLYIVYAALQDDSGKEVWGSMFKNRASPRQTENSSLPQALDPGGVSVGRRPYGPPTIVWEVEGQRVGCQVKPLGDCFSIKHANIIVLRQPGVHI